MIFLFNILFMNLFFSGNKFIILYKKKKIAIHFCLKQQVEQLFYEKNDVFVQTFVPKVSASIRT